MHHIELDWLSECHTADPGNLQTRQISSLGNTKEIHASSKAIALHCRHKTCSLESDEM